MFQVNPQRIHTKNQALFSSKDKSKRLKSRLLQFLFGALRVNTDVDEGPSVENQSFCTFVYRLVPWHKQKSQSIKVNRHFYESPFSMNN